MKIVAAQTSNYRPVSCILKYLNNVHHMESYLSFLVNRIIFDYQGDRLTIDVLPNLNLK